MLPTKDSNQPIQCTSSSLFYSFQTTTKSTGSPMANGKDGYAQLFFTQEDDATLHFGVMNGKPTSSMSSAVSADYTYKFKNAQGTGVMITTAALNWEVRNDDATAINTPGCKSTGGTDCYEYDDTNKKAKAKWSWMANQNSGGMLGPLPSFGFCVTITAGDVNGIETYGKRETFFILHPIILDIIVSF